MFLVLIRLTHFVFKCILLFFLFLVYVIGFQNWGDRKINWCCYNYVWKVYYLEFQNGMFLAFIYFFIFILTSKFPIIVNLRERSSLDWIPFWNTLVQGHPLFKDSWRNYSCLIWSLALIFMVNVKVIHFVSQ